MKKVYIISGLILVILIGILYITLRFNLDDSIQKTVSSKNSEKQPKGNDIIITHPGQPNQDAGEKPDNPDSEDIPKGSGGGGSSASGNSDSSSEPNSCSQVLAYALFDFISQEQCNNFEGETCIDKTVNCSVSIQNLDYNVGGEFTVKFDFTDRNNGEVLTSLTQNIYLAPRQISQIEKIRNFHAPDSNKNIECEFSTQNAPTKNIC